MTAVADVASAIAEVCPRTACITSSILSPHVLTCWQAERSSPQREGREPIPTDPGPYSVLQMIDKSIIYRKCITGADARLLGGGEVSRRFGGKAEEAVPSCPQLVLEGARGQLPGCSQGRTQLAACSEQPLHSGCVEGQQLADLEGEQQGG